MFINLWMKQGVTIQIQNVFSNNILIYGFRKKVFHYTLIHPFNLNLTYYLKFEFLH